MVGEGHRLVGQGLDEVGKRRQHHLIGQEVRRCRTNGREQAVVERGVDAVAGLRLTWRGAEGAELDAATGCLELAVGGDDREAALDGGTAADGDVRM